MRVTYYPVVPVSYIRLPKGKPTYPGKPTNAASKPKVTILDLVLHARFNASHTYDMSIPFEWLEHMLVSITYTNGSGDIYIRPYSNMDQDWKSIFSKTLGVSVSLSIATKVEGFTFFVPLRCCVGPKSAYYMGRHKWPLYTAHVVPHKWQVDRLPHPSYKDVLMPDLVMMDWDAKENPRFSVMEAKGRDAPIDSGSYTEYEKWKHQAENARLVRASPASKEPTPRFRRKILSIVAVRPSPSTDEKRKLQCRWFNERNDDDVIVPSDWAIELIAMHYVHYLWLLNFIELSWKLHLALRGVVRDDHSGIEALDLSPDIFIPAGQHGERIVPFVTKETLSYIDLLINYFRNGRPEEGQEKILKTGKALTAQPHAESLRQIGQENFSVLPSGIGLARINN